MRYCGMSAIAIVFCLAILIEDRYGEAAPSSAGTQVTIATAFPSDSGPGPKGQPDNVGGVGPDHVVSFTVAHFVVHDKKTGTVLMKKTQAEFWSDLGMKDTRAVANDPRMLYDSLSKRWIATTAFDKSLHELWLAVSTSSDPTKPWKGVKAPLKSPDFGFRCGVDKNGFYGCCWNFNKDLHTMMDCLVIPKEDLVAAEGPDLANAQVFPGIEIESFPATDLDPNKAADAPELLLCHEFPVGNVKFSKFYMYKITWAGKKASISNVQEIPLSRSYIAPNGVSHKNEASQPAPGAPLRADECRRTACVWAHGGSLFTCNAAKDKLNSRPGIFWAEVRASDGVLLQEGLIDSPDCDYLVPSLAVDADGNVGLGCTRTSEKEFPSVVVMMRAASDPKNTMRPPVLAAKGTATYSLNDEAKRPVGWGNYNSTCLDPSDPTTIWTYQEYSTSGIVKVWNTCWVAFKLK